MMDPGESFFGSACGVSNMPAGKLVQGLHTMVKRLGRADLHYGAAFTDGEAD